MKSHHVLAAMILLIAFGPGCEPQTEVTPVPTTAGAEPETAAQAPPPAAPSAPTPTAPTPTSAAEVPAVVATGGPFAGTIVETMDAAGYTYMLLDVDGGQAWVAASRLAASVGDRVEVSGGAVMRGFHSSSLDRTFDAIVFASEARIPNGLQPLPSGHPTNLPAGHPSIDDAVRQGIQQVMPPAQPAGLPLGHPPVDPSGE